MAETNSLPDVQESAATEAIRDSAGSDALTLVTHDQGLAGGQAATDSNASSDAAGETLSVVETNSFATGGDVDGDGVFDPGDTIVTTVQITNDSLTIDATGVVFTQPDTPGLTVVPGSINVSPIAVDDSFTAIGNTELLAGGATNGGSPASTVSFNIFDNDTDFLGDSFTISNVGTFATAQGGSVTLNADGSFSYISDVGFTGTDSFTYTIRDDGSDGIANNADDLTDSATVTINVTGQVWYVDSSASPGGDGTSTNPFDTLAPLNNAGADVDDANDVISLTGSTTANFVLESGQQLVGSGSDLIVGGFTLATAGAQATISHAGTGVTLADNTTVMGLDLVGTDPAAIGIFANTAGSGTLTVADVGISGQGQIVDVLTNATTSIDFQLNNASSTGSTGNNGGLIELNSSGTFEISGGLTISGTHSQDGISVVGQTGLDLDVDVNGTVDITTTLTAAAVSGAGTPSLNFHGDNNALTSTGTGNGLAVVGGTFSSDGSGLTVTTTQAFQLTFAVVAGTVDVTGGGLAIVNNGGAALYIDAQVGNIDATITGDGNTVTTQTGRAVVTIARTRAVDVELDFDNVDRTSGGTGLAGISGSATAGTGSLTGTINIEDGSINAGTGAGVSYSNSAVALNYGGDIVAGTGVTLTNHSTGDVTLTGNITSTITAANINGLSGGSDFTHSGNMNAGVIANTGGIIVSNLTGGSTVTFSGSEINLNNGSLSVTNTTAGTVSFTGGDLDITGGNLSLTNSSQFTIAGNSNSIAANAATGVLINGGNANISLDVDVSTTTGNLASIVNRTGGTIDFLGDLTRGASGGTIDISGGNVGTVNFTGTIQAGQLQVHNATTALAVNVSGGSKSFTGISVDDTTISNGSIVPGTRDPTDGPSLTFSGGNLAVGAAGISAHDGGVLTITGANNTVNAANVNRGIYMEDFAIGAGGLTFKSVSVNTAQQHGIYIHSSGNAGGLTITGDGTPGSGGTIQNTNNAPIWLVNMGGNASISNMILKDFGAVDAITYNPGSGNRTLIFRNNQIDDNLGDTGIFTSGSAASQLTVDISGNSGVDAIHLTNVSVTHANQAALSADNGGATVFQNGTVTYGVPLTPMLVAPPPRDPGTGEEPTGEQPGPANPPPPTDDPIGQSPDPIGPEPVDEHPGEAPVPSGPAPARPVIVDDGNLTQAELDYLVEAAIQRWIAAGATPEQVAEMRAVDVTVSNLGGLYIGSSAAGAITVDDNGGGYNWFLDSTPDDDGEYRGDGTRLTATGGAAAGRIDLLTVLMHELGHQIGLEDSYSSADRSDLMYGFLPLGERRLPGADQSAGAVSDGQDHAAFLTTPISLGTLPAGETATITWQSTIDAQTNQPIVNPVSNGLVEATNATGFPDVPVQSVVTVDSLTLGDLIFQDTNGNNVFDAGTDSGIDDVTLTLFVDDGDGVLDSGDTQIGTATSAGGGFFSFAGLAPGEYIVRVDSTNFDSGGELEGLISLAGGGDPDTDTDDNDDNGIVVGNAVASAAITLDYDSETTADGTGQLDINDRLDFGFSVVPPNANPVFQLSNTGPSATLAYTENDPASVIAPTAELTDGDSANFDTGTLTVSMSSGGEATDQLEIQSQGTGVGQISVGAGTVSYEGTQIGIFTGGANGTDLVITFDAAATPAAAQALVRAITYRSTSEDPATSKSVLYVVTDGDGGTSQAAAAVNVTAANDSPTLTLADTTVSGTEDTNLVFSAANLNAITVDDVEGDTLTVTLGVANGTLALSGTTGLTVTGDGTDTVELTGSATDINAALDGLVYRGDLNYEGSDTLNVKVDDLTDSVDEDIAITLADDGTIDGTTADDPASVLAGTAIGDIFDLTQGGEDEAEGFGGNDGFYMGDDLSAGDDLDGGAGANDQLILQGNVTATILAAHLQNIEVISILSGQETRFGDTAGNLYDYSITMDDGAVDNGERLKIWAAGLVAGEDLFFDGSAESNGHFTIYAGMGTDYLIGGSGNDYFFFGDGRFTVADRIVGDGGAQDQLGLRGDYSVELTFEDDTITGIDTIVLISSTDANYGPPGGSYDYTLRTHDDNLALGETLSIWGLNLTATETLTFLGGGELDGSFKIYGGAANDTLFGGAQADMIYGGLGADLLGGNNGNDTFVYRSAADSTASSMDTVSLFMTGDKIDLSVIDANIGAAGNQSFTLVPGSVFSGTAGELIAYGTGNPNEWKVEGDIDGVGGADFTILVQVGDAHTLTSADFVL